MFPNCGLKHLLSCRLESSVSRTTDLDLDGRGSIAGRMVCFFITPFIMVVWPTQSPGDGIGEAEKLAEACCWLFTVIERSGYEFVQLCLQHSVFVINLNGQTSFHSCYLRFTKHMRDLCVIVFCMWRVENRRHSAMRTRRQDLLERRCGRERFNPLNPELNLICYFWHYWKLTIFSTLAG